MNKFVLRFRDTEVNDTILIHNDIISKMGACWWGWWKKEDEPFRIKDLEIIQSNPSASLIYLFDRSTDRYFIAYIEDVIFDKARMKLVCPDKEITPDYYNSEHLFAWFKINKIKQVDKSSFLADFKSVPKQDYSFFSQSDLEADDIVKRKAVDSNIILHLSDIHFGSDFGFPLESTIGKRSLIDIILGYIRDNKIKVGILVVSGDITSRADSNVLIDSGLSFLEQLCKGLNISKDQVIIIPGNHDIPLQNPDFKTYGHEKVFNMFLDSFYGSKKEIAGVDEFQLPNGILLDILRINSIKLRRKEDSNYGYVDWFFYKNLLSGTNLNGDLRLAVIHHHLVSVPIEETLDPTYPFGSISVTIDSGRVIEGLQKCGFKLVLNGHQHIPGITKISRGMINNVNEVDGLNSDLFILSAGSAGVMQERFSEEYKYNSFSLYTINENKIDVNVVSYNPSIEPKRYFYTELSY